VTFRTRNSGRLALLLLLTVIGGWLRFTATSFGLPDLFRPDEEFIVPKALDFERDWNPHFGIYPAGQMYMLHGVLRLYAAAATRSGVDYRDTYAADNGAFAFLISRRVSAAMGTATVPAIYFGGIEAFGPVAALSAAAIVAVCPVHVRDSKFATSDIPATFWITLALAMILRMGGADRRSWLAAGFFCGLAAATKYPAGMAFTALVVMHFGVQGRNGKLPLKAARDPRLYFAVLVAALTFCAATPYTILDLRQTLVDVRLASPYYKLGKIRFADFGWHWLVFKGGLDTFGVPLEVLCIASVLWGLIRRRVETSALVVFVLVAAFGLTRSHLVFDRYILPMVPALALLVGALVSDIESFLTERNKLVLPALPAVALGIIFLPSLVRDIQLNRLLSRMDTRTEARQWIIAHIPKGSMIAVKRNARDKELYGKPQLSEGYSFVSFDNGMASGLNGYKVKWALVDTLAPLSYYSVPPSETDLDALNTKAILVFDANPMKAGPATPIFDESDAFYTPIRGLAGMNRPGPRIRIWMLGP
jgi:dolichyl-phosphate-mannose-protein mannosyltransferase